MDQHARRQRVLLIIDEAQNLSLETMEEIRMLSNLEAAKTHLTQILLVGQPELKLKLRQKGMEQFSQRVSVFCHLGRLSNDEVSQYIRHRLSVAGAGDAETFTQDAVDAVCEYARGIPRLINVICDAALVYGFAEDRKTIERDIIQYAIQARETGGFQEEVKLDRSFDSVASSEDASIPKLEKNLESIALRLDSLEKAVSDLSRLLKLWMQERAKAKA
jgi:general secretion pathway protein A